MAASEDDWSLLAPMFFPHLVLLLHRDNYLHWQLVFTWFWNHGELGILLNEGRLSLIFFGSSNRYIERVETGRLKSIWCLWTSLKKTSVHFKMLKTILLIAKIVLSWEKYGKSCICMWIDCKELASLVINCATSKKPYERDATYLQIIAYNTIAFYFDFIVLHLSYMC